MNTTLRLLAVSRESRRERALADVADARRHLDLQRVACERAKASVEQCLRWRRELQAGLGRDRVVCVSAATACEALLQRSQQEFSSTQDRLGQAYQRLSERRHSLNALERANMRLQEWQQLERTREQRERELQQDLVDEERGMSSGHWTRTA